MLEFVGLDLVRPDRAGLAQGVGQRVVAGQLLDLAVAEAVGAGVADPGHVSLLVAEEGKDDRRPHVGVVVREVRVGEDLLVRLGDRLADEALGDLLVRASAGSNRLAQLGRDDLDGHRAGLLAGELAPHAVGDDEEVGRAVGGVRELVRVGDRRAVGVGAGAGGAFAAVEAELGAGRVLEGGAARDVIVVLVVLADVAESNRRRRPERGRRKPPAWSRDGGRRRVARPSSSGRLPLAPGRRAAASRSPPFRPPVAEPAHRVSPSLLKVALGLGPRRSHRAGFPGRPAFVLVRSSV